MGFSQGGSVGEDILGGGGGKLWGCVQDSNPAMDMSTAPGSKGEFAPSRFVPELTSCSCSSPHVRPYAPLSEPDLDCRRRRD